MTTEVVSVAPPGYILTIEQAVGTCGGSTVKTEMYKITHSTADGKIAKRMIVHENDSKNSWFLSQTSNFILQKD